MRIFFPNASIAYPPSNGPDTHRFQIIKHLRELGHEFITLTPDQNPLVEVRPKKPLSVLRSIREAGLIYARPNERPDAVTRLALPPRRWLLPRTTPVVWEQNRALTISLSRNNPRSEEEIQQHVKVFRRAARRVDAAIGVTRMISQQLQDLLGIEDVTTIQNASDPDLFRPDHDPPDGFERDSDHLRVVWMGSHANAVHDSDLVADLARFITAEDLPIELHVFGNTASLFPDPRPKCLHHHGPVSYMDLPKYLAAMDVGLAVYRGRTDGQSPLKLFDYMASGCVPVCSPGQPMEEVLLPDEAGLVGEWTAESLARALVDLMRDRERLERMRRAARRLVETEYNWRRVAEKIDAVLQRAKAQRT